MSFSDNDLGGTSQISVQCHWCKTECSLFGGSKAEQINLLDAFNRIHVWCSKTEQARNFLEQLCPSSDRAKLEKYGLEWDAMMCEHANEVPARCPCEDDCYCKTHTCTPRKILQCTREWGHEGPCNGWPCAWVLSEALRKILRSLDE